MRAVELLAKAANLMLKSEDDGAILRSADGHTVNLLGTVFEFGGLARQIIFKPADRLFPLLGSGNRLLKALFDGFLLAEKFITASQLCLRCSKIRSELLGARIDFFVPGDPRLKLEFK